LTRARGHHVLVRPTRPDDFAAITDICRRVYPWAHPWQEQHLASHLKVFREGQMVAVERRTRRVVGVTASLIVRWDDYDIGDNYVDFTDHGMFTNHDPDNGRTLYGAEVMVHPGKRGAGVGKQLYAARRRLVRDLGLLRIRAGARLRGYHRFADRLTPREYAAQVAQGRLKDPTVTFQLKQGFRIVAVVHGYDAKDPESLGHAAIIEWLNPEVASTLPAAGGPDPRYATPRGKGGRGWKHPERRHRL